MNITLVPVHAVDLVWLHLRDGFDKALRKTGGDMAVADLWVEARSGKGFVFVAYDGERIEGASVWRPEVWTTGEKWRCLALFGTNMADWFEDMERAVRASAGKAKLVTEGRRGWRKVLPNVRELRVLYEESN